VTRIGDTLSQKIPDTKLTHQKMFNTFELNLLHLGFWFTVLLSPSFSWWQQKARSA